VLLADRFQFGEHPLSGLHGVLVWYVCVDN
jgi:hypothetical protein